MRKFVWFLASASLLMFISVAWVEGQGGDKKGKGGGFGGGFGGFGGFGNDPYSLFNRADVKKELDITDDQVEKLPGEVMVAIGKVLNEKQFKRFKQIELQKKGNNAFKDKTVQKQLKLTDDQIKNVSTLIDDSNKEVAELFKGGKGGGKGGGNFEKIDTIRKEAKEKIFEVLTKDQRTSWRDMIGEEFKFQQGGFGGFGKKDAKKDTE
jgi:hypothetical protein